MTYKEYFTKLHEKVIENKIFTTERTITDEHWIGYSFGSYFSFSCVFVQKKHKLSVELYIDGGTNKKDENKIIYEYLFKDKQKIEEKMGNLSWQKLENKRACRIELVYNENVSRDDNKEKIQQYINWQLETLKKFKTVFTQMYGHNFNNLISKVDFSFIKVKVGEFLQEHAQKIIDMCNNNSEEFSKLQDIEYTKRIFGLRSNYPLLNKLSNIKNDGNYNRYYKEDYNINNDIYRLCSQFGGRNIIEGQTASEYHGKKYMTI